MMTYTAVVSHSPSRGPEIAVTDQDGYILLWLNVPGLSCTLEDLTRRLLASDFTIAGEWRTVFGISNLSLVVDVRSTRRLAR